MGARILERLWGKTKLDIARILKLEALELWMPDDSGSLARIIATATDLNKLGSGGMSKISFADGTASATDVTVSGMASGDELVCVMSFTTKASIASVANRTSEYVVGAGKLVKAAGTDETGNQLVIYWNDLT
jgi:hypothetical protein